MAKTVTHFNGVDVDQLAGVLNNIKENPEEALFNFRAKNTWVGGTRSFTEVKVFSRTGGKDISQSEAFLIDGDELPVLMGENSAPNAIEYLLHALATSLAVGFTFTASAWGIICSSLQIDLEGKLDLHGFLGLSKTTRPGFQEINVRAVITCDNLTENYLESLKALSEQVQRTSPILDMLRNPVTVNVELLESIDVEKG